MLTCYSLTITYYTYPHNVTKRSDVCRRRKVIITILLIITLYNYMHNVRKRNNICTVCRWRKVIMAICFWGLNLLTR